MNCNQRAEVREQRPEVGSASDLRPPVWSSLFLNCSRPCSAGGLGGCGGDRLGGPITEREQNALRTISAGIGQCLHGLAEARHSKIFCAVRALDPVEERGQINELAAGVHEIKIQNLLACHNVGWTQYKGALFGGNTEGCNQRAEVREQ